MAATSNVTTPNTNLFRLFFGPLGSYVGARSGGVASGTRDAPSMRTVPPLEMPEDASSAVTAGVLPDGVLADTAGTAHDGVVGVA
jgi:hypothetical protein